jgi:hypothetical protein
MHLVVSAKKPNLCLLFTISRSPQDLIFTVEKNVFTAHFEPNFRNVAFTPQGSALERPPTWLQELDMKICRRRRQLADFLRAAPIFAAAPALACMSARHQNASFC